MCNSFQKLCIQIERQYLNKKALSMINYRRNKRRLRILRNRWRERLREMYREED